jgi:hypothetical protein
MSAPNSTASLSLQSGRKPSNNAPPYANLERRSGGVSQSGLLILNADDWGRDHETTERIFECLVRGTVSSTSAMVYMEDSERAAAVARERGVDAGLHLNFTTPFSAPACPTRLVERQQEVAAYLLRSRLNQMVFHPGLASSFEYIVAAQLEEFDRLYGSHPARLDGHHHMHLCTNVLLAGLLPPNTIVRRNFSFQAGEKSSINRLYRQIVDYGLGRRHRLVDFFFSLPPLEPWGRLERIRTLARRFVVEVETHPINADEYRFLSGSEVTRWTEDVSIAPRFSVPRHGHAATGGEKT